MNIFITQRKIWRVVLLITLVTAVLLGLVLALHVVRSGEQAGALGNFDRGNIISNSLMANHNSMSEAQIRSFINEYNARCNGSLCLRNYSEGGKDAARIIYEAAQEQRINPQVLLATLQKEQGLVTHTNPAQWMYRSAMGYGCPDSTPGVCDSQYNNFTAQMVWGATFFRAHLDGLGPWSNRYTSGSGWWSSFALGRNTIQWNPNTACGTTTVDIQNRATQALYSYTPYPPNQAALNAGYGTGNNCSSYGNRNFYLYMRDWFGLMREASSLIQCDGNYYLAEQGQNRKRRVANDVMVAWNINAQEALQGSSLCSRPDFDLPLGNVVRSRSTGALFFVDQGEAHRINDTIASAWGLGDQITSRTHPQLNGSVIHQWSAVGDRLSLVATSSNPDRMTRYLIDGGQRYTIRGTGTSENPQSLRLIARDGDVSTSIVSPQYLSALPSGGVLDYSFTVDNRLYLLDHSNLRVVSGATRAVWNDVVSNTDSPALQGHVLSILPNPTQIHDGFLRNGYYHKIIDGNTTHRSPDVAVANNWVGGSSPAISQLLTGRVTDSAPVQRTLYNMPTSENIRLIECDGQPYMIERNIRTKRPMTQEAIEAWQLQDMHFHVNDIGCGYPTYGSVLNRFVRSRNTGIAYYIHDANAYRVDTQAQADALDLGDIGDDRMPQKSPRTIHYLNVVRELPQSL